MKSNRAEWQSLIVEQTYYVFYRNRYTMMNEVRISPTSEKRWFIQSVHNITGELGGWDVIDTDVAKELIMETRKHLQS